MRKATILTCLLATLVAVFAFAEEAARSPTKADAVAKATTWLQRNAYSRPILDAHKDKDLLNPDNKVYSNTVAVLDDLSEVRFHHDGRPYDSDSITFIVKLDKNLRPVGYSISITPGGHL